jgi:hypothetical protein
MVAVAELLAAVGSGAVAETVAVLAMVEPLGTTGFTRTIRRNIADAPFGRFTTVAVTVPPAPATGAEEAHPDEAVNEITVVPGGSGSIRVAPAASSGPLFVTTIA